jgi:murein hydrolase activator
VSVKRNIHLCLLFLLIIGIEGLFAQSKNELENKKAKLQKEIDFTNKQLKIVEKNKNSTAEQLAALRKKIQLREALIGTINSEISSLGGAIASTSKEIVSLETDLQKLKREYAGMIRNAYMTRNNYHLLMFIFASNDFNQAYKRMKYLQQYGEFRRSQAAQIVVTQEQLTGKKQELEQKKNEKTTLRNTEQKQKSTLEKEKKDQDKLLVKLTDREKKLKKDLAAKQAAKKKLDDAIARLIRKEIEAARKKATAAGNKNVTNKNVFTLTPEAAKLSNSFSGNKGLLPWPVAEGTISSLFGEHPHKELKGIMVKNNGIDIQCARGTTARSIFEGTVSGVINIPGAGKAVIIRHGDYLSVYSNLETVNVNTGDKVTTKQAIGTIAESGEGAKGEVHLEIWKNTSKLDPKSWLARK